MKTLNGVYFGDKHSYFDFKLCLLKADSKQPALKENLISVPGMIGKLDITDLPQETPFEDRTLTLEFMTAKKVVKTDWENLLSNISNYLHGRRMKIILDQDPEWYYYGRCYIDDGTDREKYKVVIRCECDPYKYSRNSVIQSISVDQNATLVLRGSRMPTVPTISVLEGTGMKVIFDGSTYSLASGENRIFDIELKDGGNTLQFIGTGKISVEYWRGSL